MAKSAKSPASGQEVLKSVRNAVGLLRLQATIWALLSASIAAGDAAALARMPSKITTTAVVVTAVLALAASTFAGRSSGSPTVSREALTRRVRPLSRSKD